MKKQKKINKPTLSRKEAITKIGLVSLSAATMMLLLNDPVKGDSSNSPSDPPITP